MAKKKKSAVVPAAVAAQDVSDWARGMRLLRREFGGDELFRQMQRLNLVTGLARKPGDFLALMETYRGPTGMKLGNDPRLVRLLFSICRELDPQERVTPRRRRAKAA